MDKLKNEHLAILEKIKAHEKIMTRASREGINPRSISLPESDPTNELHKHSVQLAEPAEQIKRTELIRLYELAHQIRQEARQVPEKKENKATIKERFKEMLKPLLNLRKRHDTELEYDPSYYAPNGRKITLDDFGWPNYIDGGDKK